MPSDSSGCVLSVQEVPELNPRLDEFKEGCFRCNGPSMSCKWDKRWRARGVATRNWPGLKGTQSGPTKAVVALKSDVCRVPASDNS